MHRRTGGFTSSRAIASRAIWSAVIPQNGRAGRDVPGQLYSVATGAAWDHKGKVPGVPGVMEGPGVTLGLSDDFSDAAPGSGAIALGNSISGHRQITRAPNRAISTTS